MHTSIYKQTSIYMYAQVKVMITCSLPEGDMLKFTEWMIRLINYLDHTGYGTHLPTPSPHQKKPPMTSSPFKNVREFCTS